MFNFIRKLRSFVVNTALLTVVLGVGYCSAQPHIEEMKQKAIDIHSPTVITETIQRRTSDESDDLFSKYAEHKLREIYRTRQEEVNEEPSGLLGKIKSSVVKGYTKTKDFIHDKTGISNEDLLLQENLILKQEIEAERAVIATEKYLLLRELCDLDPGNSFCNGGFE